MTPSPSSEGKDLAALSERLLRDVEAYAGKTVMLVRVDSMSTILSALSAATKRADENDERANTYAARADELGQQLFAESQRAEAAEGALKDTRALIAAGIENLRATARDVRETERDRLKYAIMASALEGLSEAIEAADRARALTREEAER